MSNCCCFKKEGKWRSVFHPLCVCVCFPPEERCNCSSGSEGILDPDDCDQRTGQCSCMPGYAGLQCDDCQEGFFTNGTSGCLPCACDSFGAVNSHCDRSGCSSRLCRDDCSWCCMFTVSTYYSEFFFSLLLVHQDICIINCLWAVSWTAYVVLSKTRPIYLHFFMYAPTCSLQGHHAHIPVLGWGWGGSFEQLAVLSVQTFPATQARLRRQNVQTLFCLDTQTREIFQLELRQVPRGCVWVRNVTKIAWVLSAHNQSKKRRRFHIVCHSQFRCSSSRRLLHIHYAVASQTVWAKPVHCQALLT